MPVLEVNGIKLYYEDLNPSGDQRTPLLLITGLGGVGTSWGGFTGLISADRRVLIPDHRGCGRSSHTLEGLTIAQHAHDMAALVRSLHCGPVHVVGSSTGGPIGQLMALEHPDTVRSLVCLDSWARSDAYFKTEFTLRKHVLQQLTQEDHVNLTQLLLYSPAYWFQSSEARLRQQAIMMSPSAHSPEAVQIAAARMDMIMAHDALERLRSLRLPVLVLTGENDVICPPHLGKELADAVPGAHYVLLSGVGHSSHVEQPEAVQEHIRRFLDKEGDKSSA